MSTAATEDELVAMLRRRFEQDSGNGAQGTVIAGVRDAASFDSRRTIDAIGVSFWKSRGLTLDAFECKSSRSDFQRELNAPEKAERFCELCDRFWIVAGDKNVVRDVEELPPTWGLLVARGAKLVQVKAAPLLRPTSGRGIADLPPAFDRSFLIALLRQATVAQRVEPEAIKAAREKAWVEARAAMEKSNRSYETRYEQLYGEVREFEDGLGLSIQGMTWPRRSPKEIGNAVRTVLAGEHNADGLVNRLKSLAESAESLAEAAASQLEAARAEQEAARAAKAQGTLLDEVAA